jgi:replicative DNA helicase
MKEKKLKYSSLAVLPNNFFAEQSILNILLTNPLLIKKIVGKLKVESFYFEPHRIIYASLVDLEAENQEITLTTLITRLQDESLLSSIGGLERIVTIINRFENFLSLENYIKLLNEKYLRRLIIDLGKQIIIWGYTTSTKVDEILIKIEKVLFTLNQQNLSQKVYSVAEVIDEVYDELTSKIKNNETSGLLTSFKDLDALLQGFQKSDLIIIAGRPSMGKTAFALNLGKNIVTRYKIPLVVFTLEMSRQQIIYRFLSADCKINSNRLKSGKMTNNEWNLLSSSMKDISELPIFIDDNPNLTITDIRSKLRKIFATSKSVNKNEGKAIIIIDYLQLMKTNLKLDNRVQEISQITRNLKLLAKEFDIPILLLSQLSRNVEARTNKRPLLSDLRESGSIEQDADIVILLYREDYYAPIKNDSSLTEFIIAKHRNGPIGTARLFFDSNTTSFNNNSIAKN